MKALNGIMESAPGMYESQFFDLNQSILNSTQLIKVETEMIPTPRFDENPVVVQIQT